MTIRRAVVADAADMAAIYNPFVTHTTVTYELDPVTADIMASRITAKQHKHDWLVAEDDEGHILGYAYYGSFRERAAYNHVVESSIYLAEKARGHGLGRTLYTALMARAVEQGYREMIGVIALPNDVSVALHHALGFSAVGVLARSGYKFGRYLDTGFWQKALV